MENRFGCTCKFVAGAGGIVCIIPLTFTPMNCNGLAAGMMQASGGDATGNAQDRTQPGWSGRGWLWRLCFAGSLATGGASTRRRRCALPLSAKRNDRYGRFCRAGHRDLRATVAYKEVI